MRQEHKPGLLSDWESAASAGLRMLSSRLIELASSVYIAGKSEADSAIAVVNQRLLYSQSGSSTEKYTWTELVSWIGRVFLLMRMIFIIIIFFFPLCDKRLHESWGFVIVWEFVMIAIYLKE